MTCKLIRYEIVVIHVYILGISCATLLPKLCSHMHWFLISIEIFSSLIIWALMT